MYFNYLNKFGGKYFVRTTSQNINQDHDIVRYHTHAPQCDANISTLLRSPVEVFKRGTRNAFILRSSENIHWTIRSGVWIWFLLVSTSFFSGRKNVYRYAQFFFFWLTSSYVEASNKMTASCIFCVLQRGSWVRMVVQALTCSWAILPTSQHIISMNIRLIFDELVWSPPLLRRKVSCKKIGI